MKKLILTATAIASLALTGCHGTADYDNYIETLEAQPAAIDTIASAQSYADYVTKLDTIALDFESKGVKLDETQQTRIAELGMQIQEALTDKYNQLAQAPMTLPSDFPVEDAAPADTTGVIEH